MRKALFSRSNFSKTLFIDSLMAFQANIVDKTAPGGFGSAIDGYVCDSGGNFEAAGTLFPGVAFTVGSELAEIFVCVISDPQSE